MSSCQVTQALDQLSGDPNTKDPFIVGTLNRQFIRRLYDPIRSLVTTSPFCRDIDPCNAGIDVWVEGGWNRAFLQNDGNAFGFNLNGWETTIGVQKTFCNSLTLGVAGSYEHDYVHYNLDSNGKLDSGFVGLYSLYRPDEFYFLADLAFGYTRNRTHRSIAVGPLTSVATSNQNSYDLTFYGEAGFDYTGSLVLIQPFLGIEASGYWRPHATESGAGDLSLSFFKRERGFATGRVGVHVTTAEVCSFSLSVDGAWNHRLTSDQPFFNQEFAGFGTPFVLEGVHMNRNSAEAEVTLTSQVNENFKVWGEFGGEVWRNASDYFLSIGFLASF